MMKLYEITAQHRELESIELPEDGSMIDAVRDTFEMIEGEFNDKAISLITVVRNKEADVQGLDSEIKRLQARKKSIENEQQSMKDYLRHNMEATGITKIECPLFKITLGKGRPMVLVEDEEKIPTDYIDIKITKAPMKAEILKRLKAGDVIDGCSLGTSKSSIMIK